MGMKTQYYTAASLDGFIATEDDSLAWLFSLGEMSNSSYPDFIAMVGAIAMGSTTYRWILDNAEEVSAQTGSVWPYACPAWVFSSRPQPIVPGAKIVFVSGDVRAAFPEMRRAAGNRNIWIVGGGDLAGQFADAGLLDELIVQVGSVTLGRGKPLLPRRLLSPTLRLTGVNQLGPKIVELRYDVRIDAR
jgi:dihydrofolate reductase